MAYPIPTLDLALARPGKITLPTVQGGGVEGGLSQSGVSTVVDFTGGGFVTVKYSEMALGNFNPARLRYASYLAALLNGGVRSIYVPLMTDFIAPVRQPEPFTAPHQHTNAFSDDQSFTDGAEFADNQLGYSVLSADAAANAGTVTISLPTDAALYGGEWFSVQHPTRGWRAYCVTDVDGAQVVGNVVQYTVGVRPTLREAVTARTAVEFRRPMCTMRLAPGTTMTVDVDVGWLASPEISFVEAFGGNS